MAITVLVEITAGGLSSWFCCSAAAATTATTTITAAAAKSVNKGAPVGAPLLFFISVNRRCRKSIPTNSGRYCRRRKSGARQKAVFRRKLPERFGVFLQR